MASSRHCEYYSTKVGFGAVMRKNISAKGDLMASNNLGWKEAILEVLKAASGPLHYTDIPDEILARKLKSDLGATPATTVNATVTISLQREAENSPFVRLGRGIIGLRQNVAGQFDRPGLDQQAEEPDETGLINAFGMYWNRAKVLWTGNPKILGVQQSGTTHVDFSGQNGVYLLHDPRGVVYVGRTTINLWENGCRSIRVTASTAGGIVFPGLECSKWTSALSCKT